MDGSGNQNGIKELESFRTNPQLSTRTRITILANLHIQPNAYLQLNAHLTDYGISVTRNYIFKWAY